MGFPTPDGPDRSIVVRGDSSVDRSGEADARDTTRAGREGHDPSGREGHDPSGRERWWRAEAVGA